MPMAMAWLRLFTLALPRDFSFPCLYSRITLPTLFCALLLYLRPELLDDVRLDFFFAEAVREDDLLRPPRELLDRRVELDFFAVAM
jgi:hypothetical protein